MDDLLSDVKAIAYRYKNKGRKYKGFNFDDFLQDCYVEYLVKKPSKDQLPSMVFIVFRRNYVPHVKMDDKGKIVQVYGKKSHELLSTQVELNEEIATSKEDQIDKDYDLHCRNIIQYAKNNFNKLEKQILILIYKGRTVEEISRLLDIHKATVYRHIDKLKRELSQLQ